MAAQTPKKRTWSIAFLVAAGVLLVTMLMQQPVASPGPEPSRRLPDPQQPRHQAQAQDVARKVREVAPVEDVQVAVRDGTAIIAIKPQPGLTATQHRSMERQIADRIPTEVEGIQVALVTTDSAIYARVQRLQEQLGEVQRRVGPRMTETHPQWTREFQEVVQAVRDLPQYGQGTDPQTQAGASVHSDRRR